MLKLSFYATHSRREALIAVVAACISPLLISVSGDCLVGYQRTLGIELLASPLPGAVRVGSCLIGWRQARVDGGVGLVWEGKFVLGQIQGRGLAGAVVAVGRRGVLRWETL